LADVENAKSNILDRFQNVMTVILFGVYRCIMGLGNESWFRGLGTSCG
jgi:hypothetical protein